MVSPRPDAPAGPSTGTTSADWTVQVADTIESVVGSVRDKTAVPLETVARALVYGILIAVVGTAALVLSTIILVRLGSYVFRVWAVYLILGILFSGLGLFLWRKRRPSGDTSK
jgi:drug/metabolite transporter (DMT)-like permease